MRSRRARSIEHDCGESQAAEKNRGTERHQEIPERLILHWYGKLLPRPSLAIRRTASPSSSTVEDDAGNSFLGSPPSSDSTGRNVAAVGLEAGVYEAGVRDMNSPSVSTPRLRTLAWCKGEPLKNFSVSSYLFLGGAGPAKPFAVPELSIKPVDGQAIYCSSFRC
ncbi:hypothetical protein GWK47_019002 [Chionoecetes opilio]|uniref:Uncharacterized protein n=1 Tax=Chionoecetes opilio TaxID=41210 RepID=A0A8J5CLH3_CHIOP|nr:hypothetical protein GWK47_019002 [Chionoecetes opilio]